MSLADRLRDLFGKHDERQPEESDSQDEHGDEDQDDEDDPSVYPLW